ncbi:hypothetical protein RA086_02875 [Lactiplantibacillus sp. WILCCON 0030]|uniref:Uncharacterized protein n=1 Tax=Lactiplantibacillus brownii TaxID=3069269 RepID=A0ABU1A8C0_9LACO|nr:hypothetical protein [Lactiplantibacillus brownii]MDQ7936590.1 hypothetical protein [Lactiplantibacillus brownii]
MAKNKPTKAVTSQLYTDAFFSKGHWLLKIWQSLIAILGWLAAILPMLCTILSLLHSINPKIPGLWHYHEGIFEIKFIGILLLFMFVLASLFAVTMTIIQNRKRDRVVEQWPTFNPINQNKRTKLLAKFMDDRFGSTDFRENVRDYHVKPEQNLDTDTFQKLYEEHDINDLDS